MGETCSKSTNETASKNRGISREIRSRYAPISNQQSLAHSIREWRPDAIPSPRSVVNQKVVDILHSRNAPMPSQFRTASLHRIPLTASGTLPSSQETKSQISPGNLSSRGFPSARVSLRRTPLYLQQVPSARTTVQQPPLRVNSTAMVPSQLAFKQKISRGTESNISSVSPQTCKEISPPPEKIPKLPLTTSATKTTMTPRSTKVLKKVMIKEIEEPKLKPVLRQALNSLSALEIQCRTAIINESRIIFSDLDAPIEYFNTLETVRRAAFAVFALQTQSREAVIDQERNEWKLLTYWIRELLEEVRLTAIIEETEKQQRSSMSRECLDSYQEAGQRVLPTDSRLYANEKRFYSPDKKSRGWSDTERILMMDEVDRQQSSPSIFSYSTPYANNKLSLNAVRREILSNEELERKIKRQTQLMQEVVPPYSTRSIYSPRVYKHSRRDVSIERGSDICRESPGPRPSRIAPNPSDALGEPSLFEPARWHNNDHNHDFLNRSASSKKASDMALKRRLNAILRA